MNRIRFKSNTQNHENNRNKERKNTDNHVEKNLVPHHACEPLQIPDQQDNIYRPGYANPVSQNSQ